MKFKKSKDENKKTPLSAKQIMQKVGGFLWKAVQVVFILTVLFSMIAIPILLVFG